MEIVKYFTPVTFKKEAFVDILRYRMNVMAGVADDGIYLDREAFAGTSDGPKWVELNREDIMSAFHTRPATANEVFRLLHPARYQIAYHSKGEWLPVAESDNLESLKFCLDGVSNTDTLGIIDNVTHKVIYVR